MKDLYKSRLKRSVLQGKTVMNFALRKKDIINAGNYELISKNENNLFLKTILVTHNQKQTISFDISGLVPFSELLCEEISQEKYFNILSDISNTIGFCKRNGISSDSIFCDPDKIFISKSSGNVLLAVLPLNKGSIISSCARSLSTADKMARLAVSDISKLRKYQKFLEEQIILKKKNKSLSFEEQKMNIIFNNSINSQICDNSDTVPETYTPTELNSTPLLKTIKSVTKSNCLPSAFVTDSKGQKYYIDHIPFNFGRNDKSENIDVSLSDIPEISGFHASILFADGKYYIKDHRSTNGTYLIHEADKDSSLSSQKQIDNAELSNGDTFYLYHTPFRFSMDDDSSHTCLIDQNNYDDSKTMCIDNAQTSSISNYLSYITNENENVEAYLSSFPYSDDIFPGIVIERTFENNRIRYRISNKLADDLFVAGSKVCQGSSVSIFSGCSFSLNNTNYTFYIKY